MKFWVANTDREWIGYLSHQHPDEVNFWQPHARKPANLEPGTPFIFKLKAPWNAVVGGGHFVRFTVMPCFLAWEAFREKNGARTLGEFMARVADLRGESVRPGTEIGCNILTEPFFFQEEDWIKTPVNWKRNIVVGKSYDSEEDHGRELWASILTRLGHIHDSVGPNHDYARYGSDYLARARLGQGAFRMLVTDAYHRRCAISNEKTLPALEAAHIKDYSESGPHRVSNGLLLRADIHRLFDDGYVTIVPDLIFLVSSRVREEFENGKEYYRFHGQRIQNRPDSAADQPSPEFLRWHNDQRFEKIL